MVEWLSRFTEVMDCISESPVEGIGISEISRKTNLSKGTIHRMLSSMITHRLAMQNPQTKLYLLGPKAMLWGSQFLRIQDPIGLMGNYCEEISNRTGLYAYICCFQEDQVYCIFTHQPSQLRNKFFVHVGQRMPFYCSAASKAILAYQDQQLIQSILEKEDFKSITPFSIKNSEKLLNELKKIEKTGIAYCFQELEVGVSAISIPIFHDHNKTKYSLSIVGECHLIDSKKEILTNELRTVSEKASEHLKSVHLLSSIQF